MPLPWLIGAAVFGLGAAIVAAVNSDDTSSTSTDSSSDEERRRKEAAAEQQRQDERKKKRENARLLFKERGKEIGEGLATALGEWIDFAQEPSFAARLTTDGYVKLPPDQVVPHEVGTVLAETFSGTDEALGQVMSNLDFFNEVYEVRLPGNTRLYTTLMELQSIDKELSELGKLRKKLERIRKSKLETTSNQVVAAT